MFSPDDRSGARLMRGSGLLSAAVIGVFALWGGWARRWISDDGLIVLRTVRNLAAGNGPVFNVGERVEANTSVLWQYLIFVVHAITGSPLEGIATVLALLFSVAAMVLGVWATARLHQNSSVSWFVFPAGALCYLALPPARDFFTSGLEWGLSIFYLAVLWWLLTRWVRADGPQGEFASALWLAFAAGVSWLVRPELALYGGIVGIMLLLAHQSWRQRGLILAVAVPLPAAYEIFRMGYYGLLTPHTAVAKSASDSEWAKGFEYLGDFVSPYWLWIPVLLFTALGLGSAYLYLQDADFSWRKNADAEAATARGRHARPGSVRLSDGIRTVSAAMVVQIACAFLHTLYVLRVGGDFMHGRMLLLPLFAGLLPVFVIPLRGLATGVLAAISTAWALVIVLHGHPVDQAQYEKNFNIVDERDFWTYAAKRPAGDPPKKAEDFLPARHMRGFPQAAKELASGQAFAAQYLEDAEPEIVNWMTFPAEPGRQGPPTLYFMNLGMTGMNTSLNVRVLDNVGLATPLAARQPRTSNGRIGHDKFLSEPWQLADSSTDLSQVPEWMSPAEARVARQALQDPDFQELFATYRDPLTWARFWDNVGFALGKGRTLKFSADPHDYAKNQ